MILDQVTKDLDTYQEVIELTQMIDNLSETLGKITTIIIPAEN